MNRGRQNKWKKLSKHGRCSRGCFWGTCHKGAKMSLNAILGTMCPTLSDIKASVTQVVNVTGLIETWSQLKASINNITVITVDWKRAFCFFMLRIMPKIEDAPLCAQGHPENHSASILCSLMRFKAIMPLRITRVMIIAHFEWCDLELTPVHLVSAHCTFPTETQYTSEHFFVFNCCKL